MSFSVEIDHFLRDMTIAQLGKFMLDEDLCKLISDLEDGNEAFCDLKDGRKAKVTKEQTDNQTEYEVVLKTSIPVSTQIFVMANDEEAAKAVVQRLLAEKKIFQEDFLNFSEGLENGFQYRVEQTEVEDWRVQDIYPKLSI